MGYQIGYYQTGREEDAVQTVHIILLILCKTFFESHKVKGILERSILDAAIFIKKAALKQRFVQKT